MSGSATFTMLESSTAMMVPVITVPAITHLCAPRPGRAARGGPGGVVGGTASDRDTGGVTLPDVTAAPLHRPWSWDPLRSR